MRLSWILVLLLVVSAVLAKVDMDDDDDEEYGTVDVQKPGKRVEGLRNPCNIKECQWRGQVCVLEDNEAVCVCQTCDPAVEGEVKVCSRDNVTYNTECELDRDHCLCKTHQPGCQAPNGKRTKLNYFHECIELTECPGDEIASFALRMRDWLFRMMTTQAYRNELDEDFREMTEKAMNDKSHSDAVIWKFCDLDKDPEDRFITRRELMYMIASVKAMEHCLVPFLNKCDVDNDNNITLMEWGSCLEIGHEAIVDKCQHHRKG